MTRSWILALGLSLTASIALADPPPQRCVSPLAGKILSFPRPCDLTYWQDGEWWGFDEYYPTREEGEACWGPLREQGPITLQFEPGGPMDDGRVLAAWVSPSGARVLRSEDLSWSRALGRRVMKDCRLLSGRSLAIADGHELDHGACNRHEADATLAFFCNPASGKILVAVQLPRFVDTRFDVELVDPFRVVIEIAPGVRAP